MGPEALIQILVGGFEHVFFCLSIYWEWNVIIPTDFQSIIFQRGRVKNHQPGYFGYEMIWIWWRMMRGSGPIIMPYIWRVHRDSIVVHRDFGCFQGRIWLWLWQNYPLVISIAMLNYQRVSHFWKSAKSASNSLCLNAKNDQLLWLPKS